MSRSWFLVLAAALAISGCADDSMKDLKAYAEEVKSRPGGPIKPVPEFKPAEAYTYAPADRRSPSSCRRPRPSRARSWPVEPDRGPTRTAGARSWSSSRSTPCGWVGILEQDNEIWGLVQSKEKTIYRVQPDNYMGQNHGKINRITEDQIELTELIPDGIGGYIERRATLALAGTEGSAKR